MLRPLFYHSSRVARRILGASFGFLIFVLFLLSGCTTYSPSSHVKGPAIALSSANFNFKTVVLGQSVTSTLHLTNSGTAPLSITGLSLPSKEFIITGPSVPRVVLPSMSLDYTLTFTPTSAGSASANLTILSNAMISASSVSLTGIGENIVAAVQVSPSTVNFGNLTLQTSSSKNVTLQNSGDLNLTINGITVAGAGFGYSDLSPGFSLAPNQSITFQVWFRPQVKGSALGTLSILSANLASPVTMSLSGDGTSSTPVPPTPAPPPPPAAVQHTVQLTWNPSDSLVAGYRVYRSQTASSGFQPLSSALVSATDFSDATVVSGNTYYYAVTSVNSTGEESSFSNQASAVIPTP